MIDPKNIIKEINKKSIEYFTESTFALNQKGLKYQSHGTVTINIEGYSEETSVIRWLKDFWVSVEISFKKNPYNKADKYNIFFSLSVFKGDEENLLPVFRAEWDNYDTNLEHPQPHWHFYVNNKQQYDNFDDYINKDQPLGFESMINYSNKVDINKFHFAMNALWQNNQGHIHKIDNDKDFIQWFIGLIGHIKTQLEYISK